MTAELKYCNDTYVRGRDGVWRYAWGDPVPGASDLTLADLLAIDDGVDTGAVTAALRPVSEAELEWLTGRSACMDDVLVRPNGGRTPNAGDLIIGMSAPELHVRTMLTVAEIADLADVSKATIDSYRYRGYLPTPQSVRGRTPLWARPVIRRWLKTRPGCGWRTDIYGDAATARQGRPTAINGRQHVARQPAVNGRDRR